jgi:ABC-2 type transport system ATP-binding protein
VIAAIETSGLTRTFPNGRGVHGLDLAVRAGEIFGFLGPNGAGKSTTIRVLLGLAPPTGGRVRVLGLDPRRARVELLRRVGYLPGELALFPRLTGADHLTRIARARGSVDAAWRDELCERFQARLHSPVRSLSKGERQKIGLVAACMHRPELLVLDEPTSGLDPLMQDEFARLLEEERARGTTVFLSSHELAEVQRTADRVTIIRDGRIVVTDTVDGLRRQAPRSVSLVFAHDVDPAPFAALDGVSVTSAAGRRLDLAVAGPVTAVLRAALAHGLVDLTATPADLDELFLTLYRTDSAGARSTSASGGSAEARSTPTSRDVSAATASPDSTPSVDSAGATSMTAATSSTESTAGHTEAVTDAG